MDGDTELPAGWAWVALGDVADTALGKMLDKKQSTGLHPTPYLRNVNVQWGQINTDELLTMDIEPEDVSRYMVSKGDLVVCEGGEVGRCAIWHKDDPVAFQKALHRVRPTRALDTKYLRYYLEYAANSGKLARYSTGSTIKHLPQQRLREVPVPLPPLAEQQRIVEVLEEQLPRLDVALCSLRRAEWLLPRHGRALNTAGSLGRLAVRGAGENRVDLADIERRRRAVWAKEFGERKYREPVEKDGDFPLEVPDGWCVASLEQVTNPVRVIRYGILKPKVRAQGVVPYVEVRDLAGCSLVGKTLNRTTTELDEQFSGARIEPGDLLIAVRGSYERSAVVPRELSSANISRDVARIAPLQFLLPEFLQVYLQSEAAQRYLKKKARGVAVKGVNISALRAMPVPVPPMDVQRGLVEEVQDQGSIAGAVSVQVQRAQRKARSLRSALLRTAFAGELVPQDPADEPASVLLSRIAAERAPQEKRKRTRRSTAKNPAVLRPAAPTDAAPEPTVAPALAVQQEFNL
ncbi:restriction endonuclease subunit S [Streptomyces sp. NPDC091290]|uniref:restriction endonuclease subunit S n=1 Tax=Streptomyces sp. NPDC091290 TaxID=3365990 RepID=UPI00380F4CCB